MNGRAETKQGLFIEMHHPIDPRSVMNTDDIASILKEGALARQSRVHLARGLVKKFNSPTSAGVSRFIDEVERRHNKLAATQIMEAIKSEFEVIQFIEADKKNETEDEDEKKAIIDQIGRLNRMIKGAEPEPNHKRSATIPDVFHQAKASLDQPRANTNFFGGFPGKPKATKKNEDRNAVVPKRDTEVAASSTTPSMS